MKNRIVNLLLALALVLTFALTGMTVYATETDADTESAANVEATESTETTEAAEPRMTASDSCIDMIKGYEGFSLKPYWDYAQWTVGYGTRCPADKLEEYKANGISREAAEQLLRNYVGGVERYMYTYLIDRYDLEMSQQQFDALISFSYNVGSGWMTDSSSSFRAMVISGTTDPNTVIDKFSRWCNAGGSILTGLVRRRLCEANVYLYGQYVQVPPAHICYVRYDGNGGSISDKLQGYNADITAKPIGTAARSGHTFDGWYTMAIGGTKVEVLDKSVANLTLYAHWISTGETGVEQPQEAVEITVTGNAVNLRQGPGTNYSIMGQANSGDKLEITAVATGGSLAWGMSEKGWICLDYTNFWDLVEEPDDTEPEETEPEETEPEQTEPEETEPEQTEPEETEPDEGDPSPVLAVGTVKVSDELCIRSGPSTGYSVVGSLKNGARVEILEKKTVGSMTWGRISKGWISMSYVVLDKTETVTPPVEQQPDTGTATGVTGTVKVSDVLCIRNGAGTSYSVAGYLKNGTKVTIFEQKTAGGITWGRMEKGWICMTYVVLDKTQTQQPTTPTEPEQTEPEQSTPDNSGSSTSLTGTVSVSDVLCIRSGAGTTYSVAGYLKNGTKVTISEQKTVGSITWGRMEKGWICMSYVKLDATNVQPVTKTVTATCLCVRSSAVTGSVVAYYYEGAQVTILEQKTVNGSAWGRTDKGWISMNYVK